MIEMFVLAGVLLCCVIGIAVVLTEIIERRLCQWCGSWYTILLWRFDEGEYRRCKKCGRVSIFHFNSEAEEDE